MSGSALRRNPGTTNAAVAISAAERSWYQLIRLILEHRIMTSVYDHLTRILSNGVSSEQRLAAMRGFAGELHWTPSFELHNSYGVEGADDHLIVEHGLENS